MACDERGPATDAARSEAERETDWRQVLEELKRLQRLHNRARSLEMDMIPFAATDEDSEPVGAIRLREAFNGD